MKIEMGPIPLTRLNLDEIRSTKSIKPLSDHPVHKIPLSLSDDQVEFVTNLIGGVSIADFAINKIKMGVLPKFERTRNTLNFLASNGYIQDPEVVNYFLEREPETKSGIFSQIKNLFTSTPASQSNQLIDLKSEMLKFPIFQVLPAETVDLFLSSARLVECPAHVPICRTGQKQRSLLLILKGECSIYRANRVGQRRKIASAGPYSVMGEFGFFLNEPRTADVITDTECLIVKISYSAEKFDYLVKNERGQILRNRISIMHALSKSSYFAELPQDCYTSMIMAGKVETLPAETSIIREGQDGSDCFLILSGKCIVSAKGASLRVLGQGDVFGEMALMITGGMRTATVKTQEKSQVLRLSINSFYRLLAENLFLASEFERLALDRENINRAPVPSSPKPS